ncbi:hypothetical protein Tco_1025182, partial [Tanacetum coccineum]
QAQKSHQPYAPTSKQSSSTRSNASTKFKGKEIAKPITPLSESASKEDSDPEQAQRDKDMQKNLALIVKYFKKIYKPTNNNIRTSSNSRNKNVDNSPRYKNDNQIGQFRNQRTVTVSGARETVGSQVALDHCRDAFSVIYLIYAHSSYWIMSANVMNRSIGIDIPVRMISYHWANEHTVMSDSDESTVTYTEAPPSPDYIPGPEEPQSPPLPDFVPEPVYPEYMPHEDEEFPVEEQPLPVAASPTAQSSDYVPDSDPEEDPEEDDDEDPEEDPTDYPADGGDDGDDEDEPSNDDEDEKVDIEADDEEEEEHPAPADSTNVALLAADQAPSTEETEPFKTGESAATPPPHPAYRITARISILALVLTPDWSDAEVARLLTISTPPSSPLSPWSSPLP